MRNWAGHWIQGDCGGWRYRILKGIVTERNYPQTQTLVRDLSIRNFGLIARRPPLLPECTSCGCWRFLPTVLMYCSSLSMSGHRPKPGVFSWTVTHQAFHPALLQDVPICSHSGRIG